MKEKFKKVFLNEIDEALKEARILFNNIKENPEDYKEKLEEAQTVINDLSRIRREVLLNRIPKEEMRFVTYEYFILENWGIRHPLGRKLLNISSKYTISA